MAIEGLDVLLIRDVLGRFTVLVDDQERPVSDAQISSWRKRFVTALQRYAADQPVLRASDLFAADELLASPRVVRPPDIGDTGTGRVRFLDNTVVGEDWTKTPPEPDKRSPQRTVLYGFKGGVGRSTATALLARHLTDRGYVVLVIDLDLESPGAGPLLAEPAELPRYGLVDQLVESALDNAEGLDLVGRSRYLPRDGNGELWIAPARGRELDEERPYFYVDKLNRVYTDVQGFDFGARLESAVRACEEAVARQGDSGRPPDIVLLDSRAGIHDIAAVTISRLCDLALLFAADNAQTWEGYRDLFRTWQYSGQAHRIREKLRIVASLVPDSPYRSMASYLESFRDNSHHCFSTTLYDNDLDPETGRIIPDAFTFPVEDDSAPHYPIPILFEPNLINLDPRTSPDWWDRSFVQAAYREFLETATNLITAALPNHEESQ